MASASGISPAASRASNARRNANGCPRLTRATSVAAGPSSNPAVRTIVCTLVFVESAQGKDFETSELSALDRPLEHRRLASGDHHAHAGSERGKQLVTQPRIRQPEHLVRIDHHHRAAPGPASRGDVVVEVIVAVGSMAEARPPRNPCSVGSIERQSTDDDADPEPFALVAESREQRRLPDARDPVHEAHTRSVLLQHPEEHGQLEVASDDRGAPGLSSP